MIVGSLLLILVAVALLVGGVVGGSDPLVWACIIVTAIAAVALVVGVRQSANASSESDESDDDDEETTDVSQLRNTRGRADDTGGHRQHSDDKSRRAAREGREGRGDRDPVYVRRADRSSTIVDEPATRGSIPSQGTGDRYVVEPEDESTTESFVAGTHGNERFDSRPASDRFDGQPASVPMDATQAIAIDDYDDEPEGEPSAQIVSPSMAARVAMLTTDVLVIDGRPRYHVAGCVHLIGRESEPLPVGEAVELGFTPCGMCEPDSALLAEARRV